MSDEEEVDLDWGDDAVEIERQAFDKRTSEMPPGAGRVDWAQVQNALRRHRIAKGVNPDGSKAEKKRAESEDEPTTVIQQMRMIEVTELPRSAKTLANRALAIGWRVIATHSRLHVAAVLYQEDSKGGETTSDGKSYNRGDVRYPAEDRDEYVVQLIMPGQKIGLRAWYEARPKVGKMVPSFEAGWTRDPLDGIIYHASATELGEWFDVFAPPAKPRAPRKTKAERAESADARLLAGEEWSG